MKVYLDPGHGGEDPGAVGPTVYRESTFALEIAELLSIALRRRGHQVRLSRTGNETKKIPNSSRADDANTWGADVYLSLHANGLGRVVDDDSYGMEVLFWYTSSKGRLLADSIRGEILSRIPNLVHDRGSKAKYDGDRGATVLSKTHMPAVIIEPGFITDPDDEHWLRQFSTQALLSEAIASAVEKL